MKPALLIGGLVALAGIIYLYFKTGDTTNVVLKGSQGSSTNPGIIPSAILQTQEPLLTPGSVRVLIAQVCKEEDYPRVSLAQAIGKVESNYNTLAKNPNDPSFGVMGLKLATARYYVPTISTEQDLFNADDNIRAGVRFLSDLDSKWNDDYGLDGIIQMYNLGETKFLKGLRSPDYLRKVLSYL